MEYVYAAMLLNKAGKEINEEALGKILSAAGIEVDNAKVKATVTALKDVDIEKVIKETALAPAAAAAPAATSGEAKKEEAPKEEEEDKGKTEEEAAAGLGALFG